MSPLARSGFLILIYDKCIVCSVIFRCCTKIFCRNWVCSLAVSYLSWFVNGIPYLVASRIQPKSSYQPNSIFLVNFHQIIAHKCENCSPVREPTIQEQPKKSHGSNKARLSKRNSTIKWFSNLGTAHLFVDLQSNDHYKGLKALPRRLETKGNTTTQWLNISGTVKESKKTNKTQSNRVGALTQ